MIIQFATSSYKHDSLPISAQRVVNLYAERQPQDAKSPITVHGIPGIITRATCGAGPVRGLHRMGGIRYVVSGPFLYGLSNDANPTVTQLGGQISGSGPVSMDDNGAELEIVNGTYGYNYSTAAGFRRITDAGFSTANTTTFIDGFFVFDNQDTSGQIFRSAILDGMDFSEGAFATEESKSDPTLSVYNLKKVLHVMGARTIGLWSNAGAANFPWQPIPGALIEQGLAGPKAFAEADEALFIVGNDRVAYRVGGAQLQRISQHAIERAWQAYPVVSDAFGFSYPWNGHKFVGFTFPTQGATWVYDVATTLWHEEESRDINGVSLGRSCINCTLEPEGNTNDVTLVGDAYSGQVGYLSDTVQTQFGRPVYAEAVGSPIYGQGKRMFQSLFELAMESGVGISSGQGSDPQVMMSISDNGGRTFGDMEMWQSLGVEGAYRTRLRWKRLGNFYERCIKISISDPVRRTIVSANADLTPGM